MATTSENLESIASNVAGIAKEVADIINFSASKEVQEIKSDISSVNKSLQTHTSDVEAHKKRFVEFYSYISTAKKLDYADAYGYPNGPAVYSIVHITDLHEDWKRLDTALTVAENTNSICVVDTGDNIRYPNVDFFPAVSIVLNHDADFLNMLGNHDSSFDGISSTDQERFDNQIAPFSSRYGYVLGSSNGAYYYKDYPSQKQRFICINQYLNTIMYYQTEQLLWLVNVLKTTPAGYAVFICLHAPEEKPVRIQGFDAFYQTRWLSQSLYRQVHFLPNLIDAFIARESSVLPISVHNDEEIPYDFTQVPADVDFLGYMCGHLHQDFIGLVPNTRYKQIMFVNTTSKISSSTIDLCRIEGTNTENAFNVYCVNRRDKEIRVVRFGANLSNDMRERKYMNISYAQES